MGGEKEDLRVESLEDQVKELRKSLLGVLEVFLPPKEVREEVIKNLYTIELSTLKILKTLIEYKISDLDEKISEKPKNKKKAKKIKVE